MCDICRSFKLCHKCNQQPLDGPGYVVYSRKDSHPFNPRSTESKQNVLSSMLSMIGDEYLRKKYDFHEAYCHECSKQIAMEKFKERKEKFGSTYLNVRSDGAWFEDVLQFPIIKQYETDHCAWGGRTRGIDNVWIEDHEGKIWYSRGTNWTNFRLIKKTKKQILNL
jgi:hypothetical protein